jgi:uncharacterized protein
VTTEPPPLYRPADGGPLAVNRRLYGRLAEAVERRALVNEITIQPRSARAWEIPQGHLCRIVVTDGPQVGDLNVWNRHNSRERFWAARTRQLQSSHVSVYDRLWSTLPWLRPLATITADTVGYGTDEDGARCHDLLGTRCDPYATKLLSSHRYDFHCHSNLTRAILPLGLSEADVHDVLNVFMVTGIRSDGRYFAKASPARPGDYLELLAEIDLLCALSACPGGDLSVPLWGPDATREPPCHPLRIEVYRPDPELLEGWTEPKPVTYGGVHGLSMPPEPGPPLVAGRRQ